MYNGIDSWDIPILNVSCLLIQGLYQSLDLLFSRTVEYTLADTYLQSKLEVSDCFTDSCFHNYFVISKTHVIRQRDVIIKEENIVTFRVVDILFNLLNELKSSNSFHTFSLS